MTQADDIREYAYKNYIVPARKQGLATVTVRSGDVHDSMGLQSRMPAVCGALGTEIFQDKYNLTLTNRRGPTNGANVYFTFQL